MQSWCPALCKCCGRYEDAKTQQQVIGHWGEYKLHCRECSVLSCRGQAKLYQSIIEHERKSFSQERRRGTRKKKALDLEHLLILGRVSLVSGALRIRKRG